MPRPQPPVDRPITRTEWADQRLRQAILHGTFSPGQTLVISTLAAEFGVSPTPLREALRNLSAEGLVELTSHGSARVANVTPAEVTEIYELRLLLEPLALERSVACGDELYRAAVTNAFKALTASKVARHADHAAFHRALLAACDSSWLHRFATTLADRSSLMITVSIPGRGPDYDTAAAHRHLMELAASGDAAAAAAELTRHLRGSLDALRKVLPATKGGHSPVDA